MSDHLSRERPGALYLLLGSALYPWNHVRTAAALGATASFIRALLG